MSEKALPGLYLHVPFCRAKCRYCGFYSATSSEAVPGWLESVALEAGLYQDRFVCFDTLYLGGGTPSVLTPDQLDQLLGSMADAFTFTPDAEVTIEVNPDDLPPERVSAYRRLTADDLHPGQPAINRVSIGVQSLDDAELRFLGRRHTALQAERAMSVLREAGFRNMGVDLIYGLPGQTLDGWRRTLEKVLRFNPEHLSCYELTFEEGTALGKALREGKTKAPSEESGRRFFLFTSEFLESHGYLHYEVSNFARSEEHTSRHNQKYWHHHSYLGLGPSAHSFEHGRRWWNVASLEEYRFRLARGEPPTAGEEALTAEQLVLEEVLLGLRTHRGVNLETLRRPHGFTAAQEALIHELQRNRLAVIDGRRLRLTRRGMVVADSLPGRLCP